jgi:hypothetical protein
MRISSCAFDTLIVFYVSYALGAIILLMLRIYKEHRDRKMRQVKVMVRRSYVRNFEMWSPILRILAYIGVGPSYLSESSPRFSFSFASPSTVRYFLSFQLKAV